MAYLTKSMFLESLQEAAATQIYNAMAVQKSVEDADLFDIFLSHSYDDRRYIRKLKEYLEKNFGLKCYVDWITEPTVLDRSKVSQQSAALLRKRMRQSKSLVFCTSSNSSSSTWMPWELGYFDAYKGYVAVLPLVDEGKDFDGQEYLGLYPYIDFVPDKTQKNTMWVNESHSKYISFVQWLMGKQPYERS